MQLKAEQLLSKLKSQLSPIIWVSGDEPLLVQESCDAVRSFVKSQGFTEREVYSTQNNFDWNILLQSGNSLSLFAEKKIIDLRLSSAKLDSDAKNTLHTFLENPSEDNLLLISSPKVEKAATNTKWFKKIEQQAYFVQIWPINNQQLPAWVKQRFQNNGLQANEQAIQILCQRTEGNLLATAQEIDKLSLLSDSSQIDAQTVARGVADSSRFNVFSLIDTTLEANPARALSILHHLKAEGEDLLKILNFLCREIRSLCAMSQEIENGQAISSVLQSARVWSNRVRPVTAALNNHSLSELEKMLEHASLIDQSVKGLNKLNSWDELNQLILTLSSNKLKLSA